LPINKKPKLEKIETRILQAYFYFIFCSNIILTTAVYNKMFVSRTLYPETRVSLPPHNFVRPLRIYYLLNYTKFTGFW